MSGFCSDAECSTTSPAAICHGSPQQAGLENELDDLCQSYLLRLASNHLIDGVDIDESSKPRGTPFSDESPESDLTRQAGVVPLLQLHASIYTSLTATGLYHM